MADVRKSGRAEERITDCMGHTIGIRMSVEAEIGVEPHSAEDERAARDNAVNIVTVSDTVWHGILGLV